MEIRYSTSDLNSVARAENCLKWAEFSTNHLSSTRVASGTVTKNELKAGNAFV